MSIKHDYSNVIQFDKRNTFNEDDLKGCEMANQNHKRAKERSLRKTDNLLRACFSAVMLSLLFTILWIMQSI